MKIKFVLLVSIMFFILGACSTSNNGQTSPVNIKHYEVQTNFTVPKNPVQDTSTPAQLDYAVFNRYYYNPEPAQLRAILILMPGLFGGAGDFDKMAKTIVQMGKGDVEVWTVDRRSSLLNDLTGLQAAWNSHDPSLAISYYFSGATIDGKTYAGTPQTTSISYMSEWGLDMTLRDLNTIISLIPQQYRETNVFLGGHSLGAFLAQDYAAYDFGDYPTTTDPGYKNIAGVILLDGGGSGLFFTMSEAQYLSGTGFTMNISGAQFNLPSLSMIRQNPSSVIAAGLLDLIEPMFLNMFTFAQIIGMYAFLEPNQISNIIQVNQFKIIVAALLGNTQFKATNQAALGFAMDRHFMPISIFSATLGNANGPLTSTTSSFFSGITISQPTDKGTMVYTWNTQGHITNITDLSAALSNTYTTISERYFPTRLILDSIALGGDYGPTQTTDWRYQQGMHVIHNAQMDAPVIAFGGGAGVETTTTVFEQYIGLLPPARNCNGEPRTMCGFDIYIMPNYTHLDVLFSDPELSSNNVDAMIYNWILDHSTGSIPTSVLP
ncbi:MAG: hypothetical protein ACP5QW_08610 [bacterium]